MIRFAALTVGLCLLAAPGAAAPEGFTSLEAGCGDCRVTFMKCMVAGKDLLPDARKEHNERCAAAAASCYRGCNDAPQ